MQLRENFEEALRDLKQELMALGRMAEKALDDAIISLKEQDIEKAKVIIEQDYIMNHLEAEINDAATLMIARQQPVASDLRRLIATLKISADLERIGDLAVNIAKSVTRMGHFSPLPSDAYVPKMANLTKAMIHDVMDAYYKEDVVLAKNVADQDDEVDKLYGILIKDLLNYMTQQPSAVADLTQLAFICRSIERAGDHVTNIAEHIIYLIKGEHYDLNR